MCEHGLQFSPYSITDHPGSQQGRDGWERGVGGPSNARPRKGVQRQDTGRTHGVSPSLYVDGRGPNVRVGDCQIEPICGLSYISVDSICCYRVVCRSLHLLCMSQSRSPS